MKTTFPAMQVTALTVLLLAPAAAAQDTTFIAPAGSRPLVHAEGTYIFQHIPNSDLVFEGQIAPRIIILDSIGTAAQRVLRRERPAVWGRQLSTTPMVRLRMFAEASSPVRTPSYMPKATFQLARFQNLSTLDPDDEPFNTGPVAMWLIDTTPFGHHSNGQNGCLFLSETRDANDECVEPIPAPLKAVNKENGSFSTNYVEAMLFYGRLSLDSDGAPAGEYAVRREWRLGIGFQLNPQGYVGGSIDPELSRRYGPTRALLGASAARRGAGPCARLSGDLRLQYIFDAPSGLPPVVARIEGACFPRRWGGAGIFVRLHDGQDYYNLGFAERITRLQFGVTLQRDQFLSFRISPL